MKILKKPSRYLKQKALRKLSAALLLMAIFAVVLVSAVPTSPLYVNVGEYEGIRAISLLALLISAWLSFRSYSGYRRGYQGEKSVAKTLSSTLSDDYFLINDVNLRDGYGNIDHIVLGPNGIFVIETKNYAGKIICNGDNWLNPRSGKLNRLTHYDLGSPSKQAKRNASRVKKAIESLAAFKSKNIWVHGILVFANKNVHLQISNPTVPVLRSKQLPNFIRTTEAKNTLSTHELDLLGKELLKQANTTKKPH
ncbi:MAG: NERD domain-containing protein [Candidatus Bathyarchaeota archaeon]|nr:NERD domain-containing protein [Candidatus Bathyarchaeota archaeon]